VVVFIVDVGHRSVGGSHVSLDSETVGVVSDLVIDDADVVDVLTGLEKETCEGRNQFSITRQRDYVGARKKGLNGP
jgi:hypothetical protein